MRLAVPTANIADPIFTVEQLAERADLVCAFKRHCLCEYDSSGVLVAICPGHDALADPMFVRRLQFSRWRAWQMAFGEFTEVAAA